jgi:hypothetical protein
MDIHKAQSLEGHACFPRARLPNTARGGNHVLKLGPDRP